MTIEAGSSGKTVVLGPYSTITSGKMAIMDRIVLEYKLIASVTNVPTVSVTGTRFDSDYVHVMDNEELNDTGEDIVTEVFLLPDESVIDYYIIIKNYESIEFLSKIDIAYKEFRDIPIRKKVV